MQRRVNGPTRPPLARMLLALAVIAGLANAFAQDAQAQPATIRIGAVVDATGSASALGSGEANTIELLQREFDARGGVSGHRVEIILIDSASEVGGAVAAVLRLIDEHDVHAIICCTLSPESLAIIAPVQAAAVPTISLAAAAPIVKPAAQRRWVFKTAQSDDLMIEGLIADMRARDVTVLSFLGLADAYGESGLLELQAALPGSGVVLGKAVRYDRDASSFTAPVLAAILDRPQAVLVWGIAEDSARMVRELRARQFGGDIYVSHGVGAPEFLELAGAAADGVRLAIGPLLVAEELAANNPSRAVALAYRDDYAAAYGAGNVSSFGGHAFDAVKALELAIAYADAHGTIDPTDTAATRRALRTALEQMEPFVGVTGVFDFTGSDHAGLDERAYVMVEVRDSAWHLAR